MSFEAFYLTFRLATNQQAVEDAMVVCDSKRAMQSALDGLGCRSVAELPAKLRSWEWLPEPMRSLRPYDVHVFGPLSRVCSCCLKSSKMKSVDLKNIQMAKVAELAPTNDELAVAAERM